MPRPVLGTWHRTGTCCLRAEACHHCPVGISWLPDVALTVTAPPGSLLCQVLGLVRLQGADTGDMSK